MEKDIFGTIFFDGKLVDLDKENIENLEKMSNELKSKDEELKKKILTIFG